MTHRVGMSQVKFKVRYHALLLREFTVADMIQATGLNPESVRTELQRMRQEGLLRSHPNTASESHGRTSLYRLTDDPETRLTLSRSIEAFYPPPPPTDRPTSRHYLVAQRSLDQALNTSNLQRHQLLDGAERALEMAEQAEGGATASNAIKAYLQYEHARLAYLRGDYQRAAVDFEELRDIFAATRNQPLLTRVEEFLVCLDVQQRFAAEAKSASEATVGWYLAQTLVEQGYQTDSPITSLLLSVLRQIAETANDKVSAAIYNDTADSDADPLLADEPLDYQRQIVGQAITHLPPDQQHVIALKFFIGLSTREIAQTLGRTETTIKALQHRAINRLQHLLANDQLGSAS